MVGAPHRPAGGRPRDDEERHPADDVDPDERAHEDGERGVDRVAGDRPEEQGRERLEHLEADRRQQRALEHVLPGRPGARQPGEQDEEHHGVAGQRDDDRHGRQGEARPDAPDPGEVEGGARQGGGEGRRGDRQQQHHTEERQHAQIAQLEDEEVAWWLRLVLAPQRPDRLAQVPGPAQARPRQADEGDDTRADPCARDPLDVEPVGQARQVGVDRGDQPGLERRAEVQRVPQQRVPEGEHREEREKRVERQGRRHVVAAARRVALPRPRQVIDPRPLRPRPPQPRLPHVGLRRRLHPRDRRPHPPDTTHPHPTTDHPQVTVPFPPIRRIPSTDDDPEPARHPARAPGPRRRA